MRGLVWILLGALCVSEAWAAPPAQPDSDRRLYDRVMQEFQRRDYDAARAGFRFFLELYPKSPLASNAQFWIGECHFRQKRYAEAIKTFTDLAIRYPKSTKLPAATLKMGIAYAKLGQLAQARIVLERILVQYADSPEVEQARKSLARLEDSPQADIAPHPPGE